MFGKDIYDVISVEYFRYLEVSIKTSQDYTKAGLEVYNEQSVHFLVERFHTDFAYRQSIYDLLNSFLRGKRDYLISFFNERASNGYIPQNIEIKTITDEELNDPKIRESLDNVLNSVSEDHWFHHRYTQRLDYIGNHKEYYEIWS